MKFKLMSMGLYDYHEFRKNELEKLGFKFKPNDKIGAGPMHWWTLIGLPNELIEINSLEDLIEFTNKYGDCIISENILTINNPDRWR
jgi:hypothetical protein